MRASVPNFHGFTALVVMSSVAARYFPPQVGGLGVTVGQSGSVFRIDHDEKFNQTTHLQYQPWKRGPWVGFNWRYDSGLVAGAVPDFATALTFDGDQQAAIGLFCGAARLCDARMRRSRAAPAGTAATERRASAFRRTARRMTTRIRRASRHGNLFDVSVGDDNLFHGDRYKWSLRRHGHQLDQQGSALQFPFDVQRNALCESADGRRANWASTSKTAGALTRERREASGPGRTSRGFLRCLEQRRNAAFNCISKAELACVGVVSGKGNRRTCSLAATSGCTRILGVGVSRTSREIIGN